MKYAEVVERAGSFHPWDAMAPAALGAIARRGPFHLSAETGCGGSTIVLSHISKRHLAFAIEGENRTITGLRQRGDMQAPSVTFVEGETKNTLPRYPFEAALDFVLLDGPHAYPWPQLEYAYLFPHLRPGGWLAMDDIQIPSVHELFRFLRKEPTVVLEDVVVRTAFFRRVQSSSAPSPDGWSTQGINRRTVLRYSWRDWLRERLRGRVH
jgi:hypothetical protein